MGLYSQRDYTEGKAASALLFWAFMIGRMWFLVRGISLTTGLGGPELTVDIPE